MPFWLQDIALKHLPVAVMRKVVKRPIKESNVPGDTERQLLIDVSVIANMDAGTGIQRVVRSLYQEMLVCPPPGYCIRPIAGSRAQGYCYLPSGFLQLPPHQQIRSPVDLVQIHAGDIFLGLDLAAHVVPHCLGELSRWKRRGMRMHFLVYDILPVMEPAWFNPRTVKNFRRWLRAIVLLADSVVAISNTVRMEFSAWMAHRYHLDDHSLPCAVIQLGAGLDMHEGVQEERRQTSSVLQKLAHRRFVLMVGTIEPRKGHAEALDAFEHLWSSGDQTALVIAGKEGWKVKSLLRRLRTHPEAGKRLYWLDGPSDDTLRVLYRQCDGLIMASMGEGLGLPLIEAACLNKPVLVRDIPIFREVAGDTANYFSAQVNNGLRQALPRWLMNLKTPVSLHATRRSPVTWSESCSQLLKFVVAGSNVNCDLDRAEGPRV